MEAKVYVRYGSPWIACTCPKCGKDMGFGKVNFCSECGQQVEFNTFHKVSKLGGRFMERKSTWTEVTTLPKKIRITIDIDVPNEKFENTKFEDLIKECKDSAQATVARTFGQDMDKNGTYEININSTYMTGV